MGALLTRRAPAKLNLSLEILGLRPDGYHELVTVLVELGLADRFWFTPADTLAVAGTPAIPPEDDLVWRAATRLREVAGVPCGARIRYVKRIPIGAGLGGGSSDAAATLLGLAELWGVRERARLLPALAAELGADVPFFLRGGVALARGRGDQIEPLPPPPRCWCVLLVGESIAGKTRRVYEQVTPDDYSDGWRTLTLARRLREGDPRWIECLGNGLARAARAVIPEVGWREQLLRSLGAQHVVVAGAGPTVAAVLPSRRAAMALARATRAAGATTLVTTLAGPHLASAPR